MPQVVVALGGNLGDVPQTFRRASAILESEVAQGTVTLSRLYRSTPVGAAAGDVFWNAAAAFETELEPLVLLGWLQTIESSLGRTRELHWGPRTLDLDLIFYGDEVLQLPRLTVPHPQAWLRRFVLAPVCDLQPDRQHPDLQVSISALLNRITPRPLPVRYCAATDHQTEIQRVAAEFPGVALEFDNHVADISQQDGLGVIDTRGTSAKQLAQWRAQRFWIINDAADPKQFFRDVLRACAGEVWPVDWPV